MFVIWRPSQANLNRDFVLIHTRGKKADKQSNQTFNYPSTFSSIQLCKKGNREIQCCSSLYSSHCLSIYIRYRLIDFHRTKQIAFLSFPLRSHFLRVRERKYAAVSLIDISRVSAIYAWNPIERERERERESHSSNRKNDGDPECLSRKSPRASERTYGHTRVIKNSAWAMTDVAAAAYCKSAPAWLKGKFDGIGLRDWNAVVELLMVYWIVKYVGLIYLVHCMRRKALV